MGGLGSNVNRIWLKQAASLLARGGKGTHSARANPNSLQPTPRREAVAEWVQGFVVQAKADGTLRVRGVLALQESG